MSLNSANEKPMNGTDGRGKLEKKSKPPKEDGEKKKRHFFGSSKK
jgi:hypothetical protein